MTAVGSVLYAIVWVFLILLIIRLVVDWVQVFARQWVPTGVLLVVLEGVYTATDPPIKLVRRWVPVVRIGPVGLDLSFMLVFIACWLLLIVISGVFAL
ncbi:YggT family protein [Nocardioides jishulii]|uniref:YggT family protein n=1 Tax=Nocardioides jishulii TaxID=2575440 RepID=A0A4V5TM18_9ACTN|nr:YggT family protein [Nocardioides jishulii]QCX27188.1 YggT family protein [Nocardioides jishulii]TKI61673.1 YggT family protein [Nocardioides jishulii]